MLKNNHNFKNSNLEQWKYTNINNFKNFDFNFNKNGKEIKSKTTDIFINNNDFYVSKNINNSIYIADLKNIIKKNKFSIKNKLDNIFSSNLNPFIEINKKNYSKGLFLHIKDNSSLNKSITIKFKMDENKKKSFLNNRIFISIGKNVSAKIIIDDELSQFCYINSLFEIFIDQDSTLELIHFSKKEKVTQIYNFLCSINKNSLLKLFPIDISGKLIKKNYFISLNEENSSIDYNSLNLLNNNNHIDNFVNVEHLNKHTYSSTNHKNILSGFSKSVFYNKAIINDNASNSEANQKNKNLMLSNKGVVHSNPQLEIYNNDVKCSHGSTTGEIDDEILFYMQSRGLKKTECKKIILHGFANEIINKIKNEKIENIIQKNINEWLNNVS